MSDLKLYDNKFEKFVFCYFLPAWLVVMGILLPILVLKALWFLFI